MDRSIILTTEKRQCKNIYRGITETTGTVANRDKKDRNNTETNMTQYKNNVN